VRPQTARMMGLHPRNCEEGIDAGRALPEGRPRYARALWAQDGAVGYNHGIGAVYPTSCGSRPNHGEPEMRTAPFAWPVAIFATTTAAPITRRGAFRL